MALSCRVGNVFLLPTLQKSVFRLNLVGDLSPTTNWIYRVRLTLFLVKSRL